MKKYDIAVIGGGIAGLYFCYRSKKNIALFEASNRIGGRIETVNTEGFNSEYGSMTLDPSRQPIIRKLIEELDLEFEPFPEYSCPIERKTIYNLKENEKNLSALELFIHSIQKILDISDENLFTIEEKELDSIRKNKKYKGRYLWEQGLWNVLSDVLSFDAIKYIINDGSFYHEIHENPNAVEWMIGWIKRYQMSPKLKGIKNGMGLIIDEMNRKIKQKGLDIYITHRLKAISKKEKEDYIELIFNNGNKILAKHVILAIPPRSMKSVEGIPENIRRLLSSVIEIPLIKCFFVVKDPWWESNLPHQGLINFPARELHYYKDLDNKKGNISVCTDGPYINFWKNFVKKDYHKNAEICGNKELPNMFARLMNINSNRIVSYGIRDWSREPYGAGFHLWKPGVKSWEIREELESFSLDGKNKNIHVCGEAFSDFQGYMEGAIRTSEDILKLLN